MAEGGEETNKSEDATPFKLDRARRKGMLARGTDLGFLASLIALAIAAQLAGEGLVTELSGAMRRNLSASGAGGRDPMPALARGWNDFAEIAAALALPLALFVVIAVTIEIVQNRGFIFTTEPLKPDFTRLNPAKGLKRLFSLRMLKELLKNLVKLAVYGTAAYLFISSVAEEAGPMARDGRQLASVMVRNAGNLLLLFIFLSAAMAILDQLLARREFARQMRMSRREVTREVREREGEPRQKQKRRQILNEIMKQAASAANVKGADILIVNPVHYAVALRYRPEEGDAPVIQARGRNLWAQCMRKIAEREGVVIVRNPALARALYRGGQVGRPISGEHFVAVADIYIALRRALAQGSNS